MMHYRKNVLERKNEEDVTRYKYFIYDWQSEYTQNDEFLRTGFRIQNSCFLYLLSVLFHF